MQKLFALLSYSLCGIVLASCSLFDWCQDNSGNLGKLGSKIKILEYSRNSVYNIHYPADEGNYSTYDQSGSFLEKFSLKEDSSFFYFGIIEQDGIADTVKKFNGSFSIYNDKGFKWFVLRLKTDTLLYKNFQKDTLNNKLIFDDFFSKIEFDGIRDSLLSDVSGDCFSLATKMLADPDWCPETTLRKSRTFCLKLAE